MFEIRQRGSTAGREVLAGATTFMAMSYILFVQPAVLSKAGMDPGGIFMATCIASAAACILMGLLSNYPIALAPGMGENFFFVFTLCGVAAGAGAFRLQWPEALALTVIVGALFLVLSLVGFRSRVLNAIPDALKSGIAAGIGLFIALIGFEWGNVTTHDPATCVKLADMRGNYVAALTLLGLAVTLALAAYRVRGAILLGILFTTACTWGYGRLGLRAGHGITFEPGRERPTVRGVAPCSPVAQAGKIRPGDAIAALNGEEVATPAGFDAAWEALEGNGPVEVRLRRKGQEASVAQPLSVETFTYKGVVGRPAGLSKTAGKFWAGFRSLSDKIFSRDWIHVLSFAFILLFMDLFDTVGTLVGVAKRAGLMQDGRLPRAERALAADAIGTVAGAGLGTSTVTSYIESITGVQSGGRTGLTAIVAGGAMLIALLFQPLVEMVGGGVKIGSYPWGDPILRYPMISPALIVVGAMMIRAVRDVQWEDITEALPAFLAMITMPFAYSISAGIAIGFVAYAFGKLVTGRARECPLIVYVFAVLFVLEYAVLMP